jgi:hypothetical protein
VRQGHKVHHSPPSNAEAMELYLRFPLRLHGVVLNKLSLGIFSFLPLSVNSMF